MYSNIGYSGIILVGSILIYGCSAALKVPTPAEAQKTGIQLSALSQGRDLYIGHCASCHNLYLPEKYTAAQWKTEVNLMQKKAKIDDVQKETILKYLILKSRN